MISPNHMKKILVFSLAYYPYIGGAEVAIKEITDRISDIEFHMITMRFSRADLKKEKIGNVFVHRVGSGNSYLSKILFIPRATFAGLHLNRAHHFDGMWAMMSYMLYPVVLMRMLGVRIPYVLTLQEGDTYEHMFHRLRVFPFLPLLTWGFRRATVVQAISTYLGRWARKRGFKGFLEIVPNGVDVARFSEPSLRFAVRKTLGIRESETILITVSRLVHKNAIDDVVRALPDLPGVYFLVLGGGQEERALRSLADGLGVASRVKFLGHVEHEKLPAYLQASTIFIRPSRSEGMGNSFIEAMAAGVPVIATQVGGIADFLFDSKRNPDTSPTGWAVEKDSPEQIVQAVKEILSNPSTVKKVIENARKLVCENYDWNFITQDMQERVFCNVLKN